LSHPKIRSALWREHWIIMGGFQISRWMPTWPCLTFMSWSGYGCDFRAFVFMRTILILLFGFSNQWWILIAIGLQCPILQGHAYEFQQDGLESLGTSKDKIVCLVDYPG
jgi:hypothetical protein